MKRPRSDYGRPRNFNPRKPTTREDFYTKDDIFESRMASILMCPKSKIEDIFSQRTVTTIRLNPLVKDPEKTKERLERHGLELKVVPWSPLTYIVLNMDKSEVAQLDEYVDGRFYIQNLSSILSSLVLDPKEGDNVLDMCAAPGSKTTHLAALMNNKGTILANDLEASRMMSLKNVIQQFKAKIAKATLSDATEFGKKYPNYFDKVLLDAPCSGEGMIYLKGEKPLRFWSIDKVKRCMYLQRDLIFSAFRALKDGGTMVYSTCTLEPEENEGVITYFLEHFRNARVEKIELISSPEFGEYKKYIDKGITKWSGNNYAPDVKDTVRVIPSSNMMGFYVAKIRKV